jgi:Fe2+ transport system protein FeoA
LPDGWRVRHGYLSFLRLRIPARIQDRAADLEPLAQKARRSTRRFAGRSMTRTLVACRAGDRVIVGSIEGSPARIDKLASVGILPGVELRVQQTRPVVLIESEETVLALERELAANVVVVAKD